MSADNYFVIRRAGPRFVVSMGFASDEPYRTPDGYVPVEPSDHRFDTLEAARKYAVNEYSEYGVREILDEATTRRQRAREDADKAWHDLSRRGYTPEMLELFAARLADLSVGKP